MQKAGHRARPSNCCDADRLIVVAEVGGGAGLGLAGSEFFRGGVVVVDRGEVFTGRLAARFVGRAGDVDRDGDSHFGMQVQRHAVDTDGLDRGREIDLRPGNVEAVGDERIGVEERRAVSARTRVSG